MRLHDLPIIISFNQIFHKKEDIGATLVAIEVNPSMKTFHFASNHMLYTLNRTCNVATTTTMGFMFERLTIADAKAFLQNLILKFYNKWLHSRLNFWLLG